MFKKHHTLTALCLALFVAAPIISRAVYQGLPSGFDGGGFCGIVAAHPSKSGYLISGHDAGGFHISTDGGATWVPANAGLDDRHELIVASIAFSVKTSGGKNRVYAATGRSLGTSAEGGGFLVSYDEGLTWQRTNPRNQTSPIQPRFCGTGSPDAPPSDDPDNSTYAVPREHPRSTGNLIALDENNGSGTDYIYVATYSQGVMRSTDGGTTWTSIGLAGKLLRTLVIGSDGRLWTGAYGKDNINNGGVFSIANPRATTITTGDWTHYTDAPLNTEELTFIGSGATGLWAVGATGPWYSNTSKAVVAKLNSSYQFVNKLVINQSTGGEVGTTTAAKASLHTSFYSIDGYFPSGGSGATIFAGIWEGGTSGTDGSGNKLYQSIWRSTDSGSTWDCITDVDDTYAHTTLFDSSGDNWWLSVKREIRINGSTYTPSMLKVVTISGQKILYCAGRSGMWRTANPTATHPDWYPVVANMNATFHSAAVVDRTGTKDVVYTSDADWAVVVMDSDTFSVTQNPPVGTGYGPSHDKNYEDQGLCLALDPESSAPQILYSGVGYQRDNLAGNLYFNASASGTGAPGTWIAVGGSGNNLRDVTPNPVGKIWSDVDPQNPDAAYKKRPVAVAVGRSSDNSRVLVLVAVQGAGIYRTSRAVLGYPSASGWTTWSQVATPAANNGITDTNEKSGTFYWPSDNNYRYVYFLDKQKGLFRSDDRGLSWTRIWTTASGSDNSGFLTGIGANTLFVSHQNGSLYRLDSATTTSTYDGTTVPTVSFGGGAYTPGAINTDAAGKLHIAAYGWNGSVYEARLYIADSTANTSFTDQSDTYYKGQAKWPTDLAVGRTSTTTGQKGNVYVPSQGQGVAIAVKP